MQQLTVSNGQGASEEIYAFTEKCENARKVFVLKFTFLLKFRLKPLQMLPSDDNDDDCGEDVGDIFVLKTARDFGNFHHYKNHWQSWSSFHHG